MANKKYMVFGWNERARIADLPPADKLLGTTSNLDEEEVEALSKDDSDDGYQHFGFTLMNKRVTLAENLMQGKDFMMKVLVSYDHINGIDGGSAIVAYYEIPRSEA